MIFGMSCGRKSTNDELRAGMSIAWIASLEQSSNSSVIRVKTSFNITPRMTKFTTTKITNPFRILESVVGITHDRDAVELLRLRKDPEGLRETRGEEEGSKAIKEGTKERRQKQKQYPFSDYQVAVHYYM